MWGQDRIQDSRGTCPIPIKIDHEFSRDPKIQIREICQQFAGDRRLNFVTSSDAHGPSVKIIMIDSRTETSS
ncbi:unnamed protein product [Ambrosiozyma monospora]|uniref:Unnamed protein product n=1 Tax=Ambrosiozyma monospora TaxID=43982 RepID=A0ACB5T3A1_AMBMO|nr:unnamed protein product [Ambrosiozyma monospora]